MSYMVDSYSDILLAPFAKYLTKYGEWQLSDVGAGLLIPFTDYHFKSILIKSKRLSYSADKSWEFIASVIIKEKDQFSADDVLLFQRLKGYECEIKRTGLIKKTFQFQSSPLLSSLEKEIPSLYINTSLVELLNQNTLLQEYIGKIAPDNLSIRLFSQPIITKELDTYCREFRKLYDSPSEIIWNVSIEKFIDAILSKKRYQRTLDLMTEVLEMLSAEVWRITRQVERRL